MTARIKSLRNGVDPINDASRNDLVSGDIVTVTALDAALATYNWAIVFAPQSPAGVPSTATFTGDVSAVSPETFTVDNEGAYLIRLIVDAGLASESTQYVRLRALTASLGLQLVAAGERRDTSGIIPVDVSVEGWSNEQNFNLQALEAAAIARSYPYLFPMDAVGGGLAVKVGWVPTTCVLTAVNVYMTPVNTQGTFVLNWINLHTGFGGSFDMNSLGAATVTSVPLPAAGDPSLVFDPALSAGRWDITLVSNNAAYDGGGVNIELIFGVS